MHAECAEPKVAADIKLGEAQKMMEDALKKLTEANSKTRAAELLEGKASIYYRAAERKLHEVEAREDDLRRQINSFKNDCDAKEKEILLERQSLSERHKTVQQSQKIILDGQALLNKREDYILGRSQEISHLEKELEASRLSLEQEWKELNEEKDSLRLEAALLAARDKDLTNKENELKRKAEELCSQQEEIASKEHLMEEEIKSKRRTAESRK